MSEAKPYPTPLEYDPDSGELSCRGAAVAHLYDVDDFPCIEMHGADGGAIQQEIDATGNAIALRYNTQPDLLAACKAFDAYYESGDLSGFAALREQIRDVIAKAEGRTE